MKKHDTNRIAFMLDALEELKVDPVSVLNIEDESDVVATALGEKYPEADIVTTNPSNLEEMSGTRKFNLLVCVGELERIKDLSKFLEKLRQRTKKLGLVYLEVPNNLAYSRGASAYRPLRSKPRQVEWHLPMHTWEKYLTDAGFKVAKRYRGTRKTWEFIWILKP